MVTSYFDEFHDVPPHGASNDFCVFLDIKYSGDPADDKEEVSQRCSPHIIQDLFFFLSNLAQGQPERSQAVRVKRSLSRATMPLKQRVNYEMQW